MRDLEPNDLGVELIKVSGYDDMSPFWSQRLSRNPLVPDRHGHYSEILAFDSPAGPAGLISVESMEEMQRR